MYEEELFNDKREEKLLTQILDRKLRIELFLDDYETNMDAITKRLNSTKATKDNDIIKTMNN